MQRWGYRYGMGDTAVDISGFGLPGKEITLAGKRLTPMNFRGGKADTTEGGVRVDAFVRWPGMVEVDSIVGDIIHVTDLFTTLARFTGAKDKIPTDRLIDGLDQSSLVLMGETHGHRNYVFIF